MPTSRNYEADDAMDAKGCDTSLVLRKLSCLARAACAITPIFGGMWLSEGKVSVQSAEPRGRMGREMACHYWSASSLNRG